MSFESDFLELMPHTVTLTAPTGHNAQGQPTYVGGTPKPYRARVVGIIQSIRDAKSGKVQQSFVIYVAAGSDEVEPTYRVQLPADSAFGSGTPFIYAATRLTDETGHHHVKLVCGFGYSHQSAY